MFTYVTTCKDVMNGEVTPTYISDDKLVLFKTRDEAFNNAYKSALNEVEELTDGAVDGVSFGIPEDDKFQSMDKVVVEYYYGDNTEIVTTRTIVEVG